ncbi:hypothetical protein BDZ85DRAFT_35664 [Elsinoe ampelina]|uniref:CUE domain-containing protein n=1 Tax=Elsinoe ampelina TaxID=302913 RepID=A0A6A6G2A7_9PEZI|nr:hypothetical protein BDZ85DRAFT_35664 [Elsinoe ampelina]
MTLPPFAAFPPASVRAGLNPEQWSQAIEVWLTVANIWLSAPDSQFRGEEQLHSHLSSFLRSFYNELFRSSKKGSLLESNQTLQLRKSTFLLSHRLLLGSVKENGKDLLDVSFLGAFSYAHLKSHALVGLLAKLWAQYETQIRASLKKTRSTLIGILESDQPNAAEADLRRLVPLLHSLPVAGAFMAEGSELMDAMFLAYDHASANLRSALVPVAYLSLSSLTKDDTSNRSALLDHLYSLKAQAETSKQSLNLLVDLVTNTPLLAKLQGKPGEKGAERARTLAASLQSFKSISIARSRPKKSFRPNKGKGIANNDAVGDRHIHLLSKITQIQDLFPDLGSGFIARLLDNYDEDVELVTSHLLEDSLPAHLSNLDRALQLADPADTDPISNFTPSTTPPQSSLPTRRNIFDNDDFDRLAVDPNSYSKGRTTTSRTADDELADRTRAPQKAHILSALAAFDSDDDERDDTYDEADVGGTVDKAAPDGEDEAEIDIGGDANEELLFRMWREDVSLFARDARRGKGREELKGKTNMTDEALEGWAVMLGRDPRRLRRLEGKYAFDGGQREIERTAYREGDGEGDDSAGRGGFRGRGRGRGRGLFRGRGNVAGEASDSQTQAARHRKEANKGSRANHNRRDQRARKMARGGFPG